MYFCVCFPVIGFWVCQKVSNILVHPSGNWLDAWFFPGFVFISVFGKGLNPLEKLYTSPPVFPMLWFFAWLSGMAILVVEFSNGGYKIRKIFAEESTYLPKENYVLNFEFWINGELSKSAFQSQFFMSKIIRIFLNFFFIEKYQFRSTFFVIDIFW